MSLKNIVMIGPVYPYKGGISHYTGLLCKELRKKYNTTMVSFQMQYPKFLYKKEQKNYENDTFKIEHTYYWLNTVNPYNWFVISKKIKKLNPDLLIFQWWHPYFAPCFWVLSKLLKKYKILFLCHNVFPHERFPFDRLLSKHVLKQGNFFIVQSTQDEADLRSIQNSAHCLKTVHPTYNAFKMQNISVTAARSLLDIPRGSKVLLFFGFVREYKGLDCLLDAMSFLRQKCDNLKLLIVGDFGESKEKYLEQIQNNQIIDNVNIYDSYIPDKEVEKFFACCDLVVLPYKTATQSGIVQIAYGFEKPVIVTRVGGLPEVVKNGKTGYIVNPESPSELADAVLTYFENRENIDFAQNVRDESDKYSWKKLVECVEKLYEEDGDPLCHRA